MKKIVKTPLGNVEVKPNKTPFDRAAVPISGMRKEIKEVAKGGTISAAKFRQNEISNFCVAE